MLNNINHCNAEKTSECVLPRREKERVLAMLLTDMDEEMQSHPWDTVHQATARV